MKVFHNIKNASIIVFSEKKYIWIAVILFSVFLAMYSFTLPAIYTGGRIGIVSIRLITVPLAIYSFVMAMLVSLIIPFTVYSIKSKGKTKKGIASGGVVGSIIPSLLCCSPILPSIAAIFGAASPAVFRISGAIQGFIATYETYIFWELSPCLFLRCFRVQRQLLNVNDEESTVMLVSFLI